MQGKSYNITAMAVLCNKLTGFKKKNGKNKRFEIGYDTFKKALLCVGRVGPELYPRLLNIWLSLLALNSSTVAMW